MVDFIKGTSTAEMNEMFDRIELVEQDAKPTAEQKKACKGFTNLGVSEQSDDDWYCLLRNAQGELTAQKTVPFMIEGASFLIDSLFCEYAYIINLDTEELEVYKGFNQDPDADGRYAKLKNPDWTRDDGHVIKCEYNGVALFKSIPLDEVRESEGLMDAIDKEMYPEEEETA
jgi:hypothetical protein